MPEEKQADYYDQAYESQLRKGLTYSLEPEKTQYAKVWSKALEWIPDGQRVIDYGCGVGQFIQLLVKHGKKFVYGLDFSEVAIAEAKKKNPTVEYLLFVRDLRDPKTFHFNHYDVAVVFEVLEHIEFDREVLSQIDPGKRVVFSVPNYMCGSHVRCFPDTKSVHDRYGDLLRMVNVAEIKMSSGGKKIWLFEAIKR
jgi:2-polyprenyl-3-methyl-5-hydroxy-6-metoxy-1,4-benzoquinol methylase